MRRKLHCRSVDTSSVVRDSTPLRAPHSCACLPQRPMSESDGAARFTGLRAGPAGRRVSPGHGCRRRRYRRSCYGVDSKTMPPTVRVDRWLCASRLYKTRSAAQEACVGGHVKLNGSPVRSSHLVRVGDEVRADAPRGLVVWRVLALAEKRLAVPEARALYEDHSPPPPPRQPRVAARDRGAGRPTKAERRALDRLRPPE